MADKIVGLRLNDELARKLDAPASETQRKQQDVLRWLIANATPEMMGVPKSMQGKEPA